MADANFQVKKGLTVPKGSESEPSIIFTAADSDTGIYSPAENQVAVATAGSEVVRVNSSGQIQAVGSGSAAVPIYTFAEDNDTGVFSPGNNELAIASSGIQRVNFGTSEVAFNDGGENIDLRIEGDSEANLVFVDASEDRIGVKTATPAVDFDVVGQVRASTGILFGADTDAANALDDYEEGTFTLAVADAVTGGNTGTSSTCFYTKIGRIVTVRGSIFSIDTTGLTAGNVVYFQGLPFAPATHNAVGSATIEFMTFSGFVTAHCGGSATAFRLAESTSGSGENYLLVSDVTSGTADIVGFEITYTTT
jgi:hypothetical protein